MNFEHTTTIRKNTHTYIHMTDFIQNMTTSQKFNSLHLTYNYYQTKYILSTHRATVINQKMTKTKKQHKTLPEKEISM